MEDPEKIRLWEKAYELFQKDIVPERQRIYLSFYFYRFFWRRGQFILPITYLRFYVKFAFVFLLTFIIFAFLTFSDFAKYQSMMVWNLFIAPCFIASLYSFTALAVKRKIKPWKEYLVTAQQIIENPLLDDKRILFKTDPITLVLIILVAMVLFTLVLSS
jgi:hypothetical protein